MIISITARDLLTLPFLSYCHQNYWWPCFLRHSFLSTILVASLKELQSMSCPNYASCPAATSFFHRSSPLTINHQMLLVPPVLPSVSHVSVQPTRTPRLLSIEQRSSQPHKSQKWMTPLKEYQRQNHSSKVPNPKSVAVHPEVIKLPIIKLDKPKSLKAQSKNPSTSDKSSSDWTHQKRAPKDKAIAKRYCFPTLPLFVVFKQTHRPACQPPPALPAQAEAPSHESTIALFLSLSSVIHQTWTPSRFMTKWRILMVRVAAKVSLFKRSLPNSNNIFSSIMAHTPFHSL